MRVDQVGLVVAQDAMKLEEAGECISQALGLVQGEVSYAVALQRGFVTTAATNEGDFVAELTLFDRQIDCEVDDAVSAIGEMVEDVQQPHGRDVYASFPRNAGDLIR